MHESKYFATSQRFLVHSHSNAPFIRQNSASQALHIAVYTPSDCRVTLTTSIAWRASLGKLVLRYRSFLAAWPAIVPLLLLSQVLDDTGTEQASLQHFINTIAVSQSRYVCLVALSLGVLQNIIAETGIGKLSSSHSWLLGTASVPLLAFIPALLAVATGLAIAIHMLVSVLLNLAWRGLCLWHTRGYSDIERKKAET